MLRPAHIVFAGIIFSSGLATSRPLIHPDTLPSVIEEWALDAQAQPGLGAPDSPRFTVEGDTIYLHDHHQAQLLALEAATGKVKWFTPLPKGRPSDSPFQPYLYDGRRLIVAGNRSLYYVNAQNGQVLWRAPLPGMGSGRAWRIADLLLFASIATEGTAARSGSIVDVYALNLKHGRFAWHKRFSGGPGSTLLADETQGYLLSPEGDLLALAREGGDPTWRMRLDGRPGKPELVGGRFVVALRSTETRVLAVDVHKGETAWEFHADPGRMLLLPTEKALLLVDEIGGVVAFEPESGRELWRVETLLDGHASHVTGAADDKRAYLYVTHDGGGSLLSVIDLAKGKLTGTVRALPAEAVSAVVSGKVMVVDTADGILRAFRLDRSERPKRKSVSPVEYAKELAAQAPSRKNRHDVQTLAETIARLGAPAAPVLQKLLSSEEPHVVAMAVTALGKVGGPNISKDLPKALIDTLERERRRKPPVVEPFDMVALTATAIAQARLADPKAVSALEATVFDKALTAQARRAAYVALGAIGSPAALAAISAFRQPFMDGHTTWDPVPIANAFEFPLDADIDPTSWPSEVRAQTSLVASELSGKKVVVSMSPYLGGTNDVWVWRSDDGETWGKPLFTGLTFAARASSLAIQLLRLDVRLGGLVLTYKLPSAQGKASVKTVLLEWNKLEKDSDGDGLTDLVERRLATKPDDKDSDGDGLADSEDLNPIAPSSNQPSEDQVLFREVFFAYQVFLRRRGLVVVDRGTDARVEYFGTRDPTITLRRRAMSKLQEEAGLGATDYIGFGGPFPQGSTRGEAEPHVRYNEKHDSAVVGFDVFRSGKNALGYNATLRKIGETWVVASMEEVWRL